MYETLVIYFTIDHLFECQIVWIRHWKKWSTDIFDNKYQDRAKYGGSKIHIELQIRSVSFALLVHVKSTSLKHSERSDECIASTKMLNLALSIPISSASCVRLTNNLRLKSFFVYNDTYLSIIIGFKFNTPIYNSDPFNNNTVAKDTIHSASSEHFNRKIVQPTTHAILLKNGIFDYVDLKFVIYKLTTAEYSVGVEFIYNFWINRYTNFSSFWMNTKGRLQQVI
ncbi:hypothetical protein AGLY_008559 [Aphis glycines]|uniref:Uncharacterized protein n=1 Tax=Aphis glycines TaxID=307491 RepID=A0A6G0TML4_APHGL|nr:hypothetical protein AGLY_008559 [Aphis glycines]